MNPKSALLALGASIAIHVSAGVAFYAPSSPRAGVPDDAIFLTSVRYAEPKKAVSAETAPAIKKPPVTPVKKSPPAAHFSPAKKSYLQPPLPAKRAAPSAAVKPAPVSQGIMRADELAASPDKGKIFTRYFGGIRQEINEAVTRRFTGEGEGRVTIIFVLSETGKLQSSAVVDGQTDADLVAKRLVLEAVREAAPFGAFPAELGTGRIAFTLTIVFQES